MPVPVRLLVPLDRLDGRRHTFGTFLTGWLGALAPLLDDLVILRRRERSYPFLDDLPQEVIPAWMESNRAYSLLFPLWARRFGTTILHFPYRFAPYSWWGFGQKRVVTVHDTALITLSDDLVSPMRQRTLWRYRRALAGFDAVVTVSESSRAELRRHFHLPAEKVQVIHHGVEDRFSPRDSQRDLEAAYGVRRPFLLNVSSIKKKKNIPALVKAFALLRQAGYPHQLVLVGKPDNGLDDVEAAVRAHGVGEHVLMTGFVDESDHPEFYRQADLLVYPSLYEGFGIPLLEAMASGCPVVASDTTSLPEVAGNAALLVDPRDVHALFAAMRQVLDDPGTRRDLVEKGLARAAAFTWENAARKHLELYRGLLDGARPGDGS